MVKKVFKRARVSVGLWLPKTKIKIVVAKIVYLIMPFILGYLWFVRKPPAAVGYLVKIGYYASAGCHIRLHLL